ncbi:hypothetical protein HK103_007082 [Boothiomyces macroporosus]|uniref:Fungal lipase-type domain-containing protein n=1 Tax=Boothiomyces macroporosus TaxID=261099 RepID=A0AAD5UH05_9FUNG|nr:hypothetical protein HK103_007082 [Boothiomyces macroporosus]
MGGALALFAAIDFDDRWGMQERFSIYTYGLPRSGNADWAQYVGGLSFHDRIYRYSNKVPHLPFMFLGYRHVGQEYQIQDSGTLSKCVDAPGEDESPACLNDFYELNYFKHTYYFGEHTDC